MVFQTWKYGIMKKGKQFYIADVSCLTNRSFSSVNAKKTASDISHVFWNIRDLPCKRMGIPTT